MTAALCQLRPGEPAKVSPQQQQQQQQPRERGASIAEGATTTAQQRQQFEQRVLQLQSEHAALVEDLRGQLDASTVQAALVQDLRGQLEAVTGQLETARDEALTALSVAQTASFDSQARVLELTQSLQAAEKAVMAAEDAEAGVRAVLAVASRERESRSHPQPPRSSSSSSPRPWPCAWCRGPCACQCCRLCTRTHCLSLQSVRSCPCASASCSGR